MYFVDEKAVLKAILEELQEIRKILTISLYMNKEKIEAAEEAMEKHEKAVMKELETQEKEEKERREEEIMEEPYEYSGKTEEEKELEWFRQRGITDPESYGEEWQH